MPEQLTPSLQVASAQEAVKKLERFIDAVAARGISPSSPEADELDAELGFSDALEELRSFLAAGVA